MFIKNKPIKSDSPELLELKTYCKEKLSNAENIVVLDDENELSYGNIAYGNPTNLIRIGVKNFDDNTINNMILVLMIIFHEYKHSLQNRDVLLGNSNETFCIGIISRKASTNYYKNNHSVNMLELDADRGGVRGAYAYIKKHHPEIDAISILKKILLDRDMYADHVSDIDKINTVEDFDTYLFIPIANELKSKIKTFDGCEKDEFSKYMDRYWYETGDNPKSDVLVSSADNINLLCDKLVASIIVELHPEYEELCKKNGVQIPKFEDVLLEIKGFAKEERDV